MTDKTLYCTATGATNISSVTVSQAHESATAIATINCINFSGTLGDSITVNMGYSTNNGRTFRGYVKRVEKTSPEGVYTISANDALTRAVDYFIVSTNPEHGYTYRNITAEDLIATVLGMAGLSSFDFDTTYFTFGINNDVEVNLVSSYDYSRMISDIIAWMVWADSDGVIHLANRKPYPMFGDSGQPGDNPDSSIATITDSQILSFNLSKNDKDLRNKIVIYGAENLYADAQQATSYDPISDSYEQVLPAGFYKAAVLASPLIDNQGFAQDAANYNLDMMNRVVYELNITVEGDHIYEARSCVTLDSTSYSTYNGLWYIFQCDHSLNSSGYQTNMVLRR